MAGSNQPLRLKIIQAFSRFLVLTGGLVFFFGDKFLHEIRHLSFAVSEIVGILGGVLLMVVGLAIGGQSYGPKQR